MKVVTSAGEAEAAFASAQREGQAYFADPAVYVERYLEDPRHVEVQVLADAHGNVIHLGERDCTIQRRHQKLVEESPSPAVSPELRERIGRIAVDAARAAGYRSAGTIEGLLAPDGAYYFMEMNTRIQVEHTVTEAVTGVDLVREQLLVAAGEPLSLRQEDVVLRGHAIECRINAEDVSAGFRPAPGRIASYREPAGPGVRVDSGVIAGSEISDLYDPMIAKLIVWDTDRESARRRMLRALEEFEIGGVQTLVGFHRALLEHPSSSPVRPVTAWSSPRSWRAVRTSSPRPSSLRPPTAASREVPSRSSWTAAASRSPYSAPSRATASSPAAGRSASRRRAATAPTPWSARCRAR